MAVSISNAQILNIISKLRRNKQLQAVFGVLILFFCIFIVFPAFMIFKQAFMKSGGITFDYIKSVLSNKNVFLALSNSMTVSFLSAIITTFLAFLLAYAENFTNISPKLRKMFRTLAVFPMLIPTITYGFAVIYSFGRNGLLTRLFGRQLFDFYGFKGLVFCYVVYTLPVAFMLLDNAMSYIDKRFLIVSRLMGDNPLQTLNISVLTPLWGTIAVSIVQSFFMSFTDFGIPASIGGRYLVISELLFNTMLGSLPDFNQGAVIAILILLPSVASILLLRYLQKFNVRYSKISPAELKKNLFRDGFFLFLATAIIISLVSIFVVVIISPFMKQYPYDMSFSLEHVRLVFSDSVLVRVFKNSLLASLCTALFGTVLVYASAIVTSRTNVHPHAKIFIESVAQVSNTIPGMVLGIAFMLAFKKTPLHNTLALIICCNLIHFFATPFLMMKGTLDKMNAGWETTASLLGDTWFKTVRRIVSPNVLPTLVSVFCFLFVNGMHTTSAIIFLVGARTMVITAKIQELQHFARFNEIFILSLMILITNLLVKILEGLSNSLSKPKG